MINTAFSFLSWFSKHFLKLQEKVNLRKTLSNNPVPLTSIDPSLSLKNSLDSCSSFINSFSCNLSGKDIVKRLGVSELDPDYQLNKNEGENLFFQFEGKSIRSAAKATLEVLEYRVLTIEDASRVNVENWWNKEHEDGYGVDLHSGSIVLEFLDEDFNIENEECIGDFRSYYLYAYDPQGNCLDILDNADAVSGDLCTAISDLEHSQKWKDIYDYAAGVLYIDRFYIKQEYRGKKLGYLIFPVLLDLLSKRKDTIVTIIPQPLHDMARDLDRGKSTLEDTPEYKLALNKMKNFLKAFGFEQLGDKEVWAAALMDEGVF